MSLDTFDTTLIKILSHRPGKYVSSGQMHLIAKCEDGSVVKGYLDMPLLDERYRFYGEWRDQKGYDEKAFYFEFHEVIIDRSVNGIVDYLSRYVPHLGRLRAQALVEAFGTDTIDVLRGETGKALGIAGITEKIVANIKEHFEENIVHDPAAYAKLIDLLSDSKVSKRLITTLLDDFGSNAPDYILAHPYELMNYRRMGWIKTDRFALTKAKFHPTGAARYKAAIIETLLQGAAKDGHTAVGKVDVEMGATGLCGSRIPVGIWEELEREGRIVKIVEKQASRDGTELEKEYYSLMKLWHAEREIARLIVRIQENAIPLDFTFDISRLEDEQIDAARLAERHGVAIIAGSPGTGKAQPLDAIVYTVDGSKLMGDIQVGDLVIGSDGLGHSVTGIFPQGIKEILRITFDDESNTECCYDHLWSFWTRVNRNRSRDIIYTKSLYEIILERGGFDHIEGYSEHFFPMVTPIEFNEACLPLDPYAIGLLLGDGSMVSGQPKFCKPDIQITESLQRLLPDGVRLVSQGNGKDFRLSGDSGPGVNPLTRILRELGLWGMKSYQKFIPNIYKYSSFKSRVSILNGLLDTYGYSDRSAVEYSTSSRQLADDVQFIVESLGGKARIRPKIPVYTHNGEKKKGRVSYRMSLVLPEGIKPFLLTRKAEKHHARKMRHPVRTILSIEIIGNKECKCISIDSKDGLYVTDHCILTHNTHVTMDLVSQFHSHGIEPIIITAPTGKASKRASEVLEEKLPNSEITASTIHKALGMGVSDAPEGVPSSSARVGRGREEFGFLHNEENPLECSIAVIDEMSMCDSLLFYYFLRSLPLGCRLLIVGDPHQLPPVGPGNPLRDLILGGVPTVLLTKPRRNSGAIVRACHEIKDGKFPKPCVKLDLSNGLNWVHIEERDPEKIADIIVTLHLKTKRDPLWDVQCISPENAKKVIACRNLNRRLSAVLNRGGKHSSEINSCDLPGMPWATQEREDKGGNNKGKGRKSKGGNNGDGSSSSSGDGGSSDRESEDEESPFRIGDKIIRVRNGQVDLMTPFRFAASMDRLDEFDSLCDSLRPDEDMEFRRQFDREEDEAIDITWRGKPYTFGKTYVVNGDMGIVEDIIKFKGKFSVIVQFMNPDRLCRLSYGDHYLSQAYAVTIHKFQGSGIPYIIFPVHRCFYYNDKTKQGIFMRELIYTAFSRAEDALVTVGELGALYDGIKRKTVNMRKTRLYGFLRDEMRKVEVGS